MRAGMGWEEREREMEHRDGERNQRKGTGEKVLKQREGMQDRTKRQRKKNCRSPTEEEQKGPRSWTDNKEGREG